jgi:diguanylate cyclase
MNKWIIRIIILIAISLPIYTGYKLNEHLHNTIIESKEVEAIHMASHIIHDIDQKNHIGHNHTENNNIHSVHLKEDVDLDLNDPRLHENINWVVSDLRIDLFRVLDNDGNVIYSSNIEEIGTIDKCETTVESGTNKKVVSTVIEKGHYSSDGNLMVNTVVETHIPILFKNDNGEIELVGLFEIYNNISDVDHHLDQAVLISGLIVIGPFLLIGLFIYSAVETKKINELLRIKNIKVKESEEKFRLVTQSTHDAIVSIDDAGKIIFWNNGATKVFGYTEEEAMRTTFMALLPEEYVGGYVQVCEEAIKIEKSFFVVDEKDIELYGKRKNNEEFPMQVTLTIWPFKERKVYSAIIKDITERRKFEDRLRFQANYDKLTGLPNRNMIDDRLQQAEMAAKRNGTKAAILFIDLDRFKYVNDTFGHEAGDELLKQVARRLETCVREVDTVARLGGDEFLVILSDVKQPIAVRKIAKKIITQLSTPFNLKLESKAPESYCNLNQEVLISGSIGVSFFPDDGVTKDDLMKKADAAMYQAKKEGKNNYKYYTSDLDNENNTKLKIEKELRTALQNDEFYMVYQPIICLSSAKIVGVETLLRWNNPNLGNIPPDIFIPIAEEIGMMPKLGDWIFLNSCKEMGSVCNDDSDLYVSINVSVSQLENPDFPKIVNKIIKETEFPAELIQLEITESMMMEDIEKAINIMTRLTKIGVTVAIDDFGTGYSSLSYLKKIKASTLKIDKSFIDEVPKDPEDVAIVKAIIKMAQSLNLKIIAEGVENKDQVKFLKKLNCDKGQGYHYHKPMSILELEKII